MPGLPIGFALFGRGHAAGWVGGAAIGYALSSVALWLPVQLHLPGVTAGLASWTLVTVLSFLTFRSMGPLVTVPRWTRRDTLALVLVVLAVAGLGWLPFPRIWRDRRGRKPAHERTSPQIPVARGVDRGTGENGLAAAQPYLVSRPQTIKGLLRGAGLISKTACCRSPKTT